MKTSTATLILLFFISFMGSSQSNIDEASLIELHGKVFKRAGLLKTADLTFLASKEEITLQLFSDITIVAKKNIAVKQSYGGYLWKGELISGAQGYLELFSRKGKISGTVYASSKVYKLDGNLKGDLRVIELDPNELPEQEDSDFIIENDNTSNRNGKGLAESIATATNPSIIDVMILYPASVQSLMGGAEEMETEIYYRIAEANQAFVNSGIYVEFRLAHHQIETSVDEDTDNPGDVSTAEVYALREQYNADLVSYWSKEGVTGFAYSFSGTGNPRSGFNTCNISAVQSQYTFIHECGHNLGATHDRYAFYDEENPTNSSLNFAPYYHYGKSFLGYRSIMSYANCSKIPGGANNNCKRVPYFTNPDVIVNGAPFGVSGTSQTYDPNGPANNAMRINETAHYVADYYDSPNIVYYDLIVNNGTGSGSYEEGSTVLISANTAPENEVFDQWIGDISNIDDPYKDSITITMTDVDMSITATYKTDNVLGTEDHQLTIDINIFPNPIIDMLNVNINEAETTSIEIVNMTGQVLFSKEMGGITEQLNLTNLATGVYILKVIKDNQFLTRTIVKQ